jgi:phosphoserine phosphatase
VRVLSRLGYRTAVISGGFTFTADALKAQLGLDYAHASTLELADGRLTGRVLFLPRYSSSLGESPYPR